MSKTTEKRLHIEYLKECAEVTVHPFMVSVGELATGRMVAGDHWPYGRLVVVIGNGEPCLLTANQTRRLIGHLWEQIDALESRE